MSDILSFEDGADEIYGLSRFFLEKIEVELNDLFERAELMEPLSSAVHYALFSGGKRIRPLLALLLCHDLHGDTDKLLPAAAAIELLHASSLVHDDLPALDNDDFRRGKPSCHKAYNEATALLAGNSMLALAIEQMRCSLLPPEIQILCTEKLGRSYRELCNGQQLDLLAAEGRGDISRIYRLKTGALFSCATVFAGWGAGLEVERLSILEVLGYLVGEYFQVVDDVIDSRSALKGRSIGSDVRNGKLTAVMLGEVDARLENLHQQINRTIADLKRSGVNGGFRGVSFVIDQISGQIDFDPS